MNDFEQRHSRREHGERRGGEPSRRSGQYAVRREERRQRQQEHAKLRQELREQARRKRQNDDVMEEHGFLMIFPVIGVISALVGCWIASHYIFGIVTRHFGWHPPQLVAELITYSFGFFLWGCVIALVSKIVQRRQNDYFQELIEALRKISRGDFQVHIRMPGGDRGRNPFRELVKSINETAVNLKNMEDLRQEFISNVSHEIQSPLTSIGGFARVLKHEELDREQSLHYLDIIEKESARLSKLSENMLRLASLESDHPPFRPEAFRLDKQLQMLILACEPQWQAKELDMNASLAPVTIDADPDLLSQVWVNLLHNAIKFTALAGEIKVDLTASAQKAYVTVKDTGVGIAEEDLPHIFERFYKADRARSRKEGGNGLGLSIIKKIVEIHGGDIDVSSRPGDGTMFTITLPLKPNNGA